MKLLVYGAGVLGSYLAHVLCAAGHDVSVLARGKRKTELEENGLVIRHYIQRKTTVDHPRVVGALDRDARYDAVFSVVQYQQAKGILNDLANADSPLVVLVGNNPSAPEAEKLIRARTPAPKTVLFGFQPTGGRRENGEVVCVRAGAGVLYCGLLHSFPDEQTKAVLKRIFQGTGYKPSFQPDMNAWYQCHLVLILPIAYACYALDCDLTRAGRALRLQILDAVREGHGLLQAQGIPILPRGDERYFVPGPKRAVMSALFLVMAKTALGRLAASDHCRGAAAEMRALDEAFLALRSRRPDFPMPHWDALRARMPGWDTVVRRYAPGAAGIISPGSRQ
ncbi:Ketopantoate reductase family protein [Ruminococcaceae bacterium BL-6]|nr:Ketopantoate reductase family protein [Ruminococcaceae bacterium BL-6]